jgi:hypothetical protein
MLCVIPVDFQVLLLVQIENNLKEPIGSIDYIRALLEINEL